MKGPLPFTLPRWLALARQVASAHWPAGLCLGAGPQDKVTAQQGSNKSSHAAAAAGGGGGGKGERGAGGGNCSGGMESRHVPSRGMGAEGGAGGSSECQGGHGGKLAGSHIEWSSREVLLTDGLICQLPTLVRAGMVQQCGDDRLADGTKFRCTAEKTFVEQVGRAQSH